MEYRFVQLDPYSNLIGHMAAFISTQRHDLSNGLIRPIPLSESSFYICIHSSQITYIWLIDLLFHIMFYMFYMCLPRSLKNPYQTIFAKTVITE